MKKDFSKLPNHVAIIMDGNGRWATRRGLPRNYGHREGIKAVDRTINALCDFGVKYATFFAFSTENWKRSREEINGIFDLVRDYIKNNKTGFVQRGIKISSIGDISKFPEDLQHELIELEKDTQNCNKIEVVFALNYGGRADIIQAVNTLLKEGKKETNENEFLSQLQTGSIPEPDFVIRTSGEMRISNFLLYQMAYSEFYFPKVLWPDFNKKHLRKCLNEYSKRHRRFGGLK